MEPQEETDGGHEAVPPSLVALIRALIEDAQTLLEAETGYWRAAAGYTLRSLRTVALLAVLALFFLFFTLMAIVVGLLLALAEHLGKWGALGVMTLALGGLTVWFAWAMIRRGKRMFRALTAPEDRP